ncbi:glutamate racemase [Patescibacteria group bacterium]|nr:glutamate racemase [Patescibacteria group bacterium]MBU0964276.1 glutamate racemase [Patescibacteria group bacterium]
MIGIFDSGIGGLTVVKEVLKHLPEYQMVYFGDTARTPYGNKSKSTIIKYAIQDTKFLLDKGAKIIIVACNSASAVAAEELKRQFEGVPIFEVITPAVNKAVAVTKNKRLGVIGTRATTSSNVYQDKIKQHQNGYTIISKACPLFVPLAEEGWTDKPVTKMVAKKYLYHLKLQNIDTLILGCTHYPLLKEIIQIKMGKQVTLVDPAEEVAQEIKKYLAKNKEIEKKLAKNSNHEFYFSDIAPHLTELAHKWLGQIITPIQFNL